MNIDNLKKLVSFGARLHNSIDLSLRDKKLDGTDVINFLPALQALPGAIEGLEFVVPEFEDLDSAEAEDLIAMVKLEDPALQSELIAMDRVKVCLKLAVAILETYKVFKKA